VDVADCDDADDGGGGGGGADAAACAVCNEELVSLPMPLGISILDTRL